MLTAFTIAHVTISLILIVMVLLQDSKGDASGLIGGGGSKSVFGATGAASFVVKATRTVAALFAACCLGLAYITSHQGTSSGVFDRVTAPVKKTVPAEDATAPTTSPTATPQEAPAAQDAAPSAPAEAPVKKAN